MAATDAALTLLVLKEEHRDAFGCVLSHLDEHDRLFLSKTARGFRDVESSFRPHPINRRKSVNDNTRNDDEDDDSECTTATATTKASSSHGDDDDEEDEKGKEKEDESGGDVISVGGALSSSSPPPSPTKPAVKVVTVRARTMVRSAPMARWFLSQGCGESGYHIMTSAVECGSVEALRELMHPRSAKQIVCNFNDDCRDWSLSRIAAEHGQMEVLRWLFHEGHRWLHTSGCPALNIRDASSSSAAAASSASSALPVPYYKRQRLAGGGVSGGGGGGVGGCGGGGGGGGDIISEAARWGRLDALVFLRAIGVPWPSTGCRTAILSGDADVVKWMVMEGCPLGDVFPCSSIVSFIASVPDSIDILRWLKDERGMSEPGGGLFRADPDGADKADALRAAAYHGNFPVMRWLRMETGAAWSPETTAAAADGGNIDCLSWLHSNECPWDEETAVMAAAGGHVHLLQYTHREGLRAGPSGKVCAAAAAGGHMAALHWLVCNGYPVDEAAAETLEEWLVKTGGVGGGGGGGAGAGGPDGVAAAAAAAAAVAAA